MPTKITLDVNTDDAKLLMEAFKQGKLAEFGVKELRIDALTKSETPMKDLLIEEVAKSEPTGKSWAKTEGTRRDAAKSEDVPPRG